jgi:hypothetical protein
MATWTFRGKPLNDLNGCTADSVDLRGPQVLNVVKFGELATVVSRELRFAVRRSDHQALL